MKITVIGSGHLGAPHAAGMADIGHHVVGVDTDLAKIAALNAGRGWFHEPGLDDLLTRNIGTGRLRFTTDLTDAAAHGEVHFLAVGTPSGPDGSYDLSQLTAAVSALAPHLHRPCLIVGKSTVSPGTARAVEALVRRLAPAGDAVEVAWNPEFLREGTAVADTLTPDRIVIGVSSAEAEKSLRALYAPIIKSHGCPLVVTDLATAEMVKATANAYLATRISFINAVAEMSAAIGANVTDLVEAIGYDTRIGHHYLQPGLGFGGGCLPKDLHAFTHQADSTGSTEAAALLRAVDTVNRHRRHLAVELARTVLDGNLAGRRVAVWGAAFKAGVDDVRDSPGLDVAVRLHQAGAQVAVYDPQGMAQARHTAPALSYAPTAADAAQDADLVLVTTGWPEFRSLDPYAIGDRTAVRRLIDTQGVIVTARWRAAGWAVTDISYRPASRPAQRGPSRQLV
ncbi:UDP-glucose/GDP-mannose dehydrogenase family protein [Plantactinospora sp. KLBMP9567]|uniref:UDP-glucose dehydrogenase family protein n=1 Tax=Plantactinospora sp. KLBMP9567 TaxID=3085900 RepID=UPI002980A988|nr:UDP-glucose/GDP-mannose dehydrogenase family protein [Plantactinospora sp. KLBMP9567]MDW5330628.1 UDP-glucose/GDP-mannose dehydrogenase family protein [Plantactinospora sp. KLBMP9567]